MIIEIDDFKPLGTSEIRKQQMTPISGKGQKFPYWLELQV